MFDLWSAKTHLRTGRREGISVMQSAEGSDWHGLHRIPRGDGANWPFGSRDTRAADRERAGRAPCVGARHCNGLPMISEGIADAVRIAGSTNRDTLAESCP